MDNEIQSHLKPLNMQLHAAISVDSLYKGELPYKPFVLWGKKKLAKTVFSEPPQKPNASSEEYKKHYWLL